MSVCVFATCVRIVVQVHIVLLTSRLWHLNFVTGTTRTQEQRVSSVHCCEQAMHTLISSRLLQCFFWAWYLDYTCIVSEVASGIKVHKRAFDMQLERYCVQNCNTLSY